MVRKIIIRKRQSTQDVYVSQAKDSAYREGLDEGRRQASERVELVENENSVLKELVRLAQARERDSALHSWIIAIHGLPEERYLQRITNQHRTIEVDEYLEIGGYNWGTDIDSAWRSTDLQTAEESMRIIQRNIERTGKTGIDISVVGFAKPW